MVGSTWAPRWWGVVLSAAYVAVIVVHLHHVRRASTQGRLWHVGHLLMAVGMIVMFLPSGSSLVPASVGTAIFALAAVVMGAVAVSAAVTGPVRGAIVAVTTVDLAAMAFMFSPASVRLHWLSLVAATWFVLQALGWATGHLSVLVARSPVGRELAERSTTPVDAATAAGPTGAAGALLRRTVPTPVWRTSGYDLGIRITLGAMALGMGYMFVAVVIDPGLVGGMGGM